MKPFPFLSSFLASLEQLVGLKKSRRDVHQVACGNNCTLILAGCFNPPSLQQKCRETVRSHPQLMAQLGE